MPDDKKPAPNKSTARKMTPLEWRKNAIVNLGYEYAYPYTPEQLKQMDEKGEYPKVYDPRKYKAKSSGEGSMNFYNIDGTPASNVEIMYSGETIQDMKKPAMAKPMPVEGRKPIEFGASYSINPNDNTYTPYVEGAVPIKMKKGGLVGKVKGYAVGGTVKKDKDGNPIDEFGNIIQSGANAAANQVENVAQSGNFLTNNASAIGAIGSAGAAVAGMGAGYLDSTNELNEYGQINKDKATASGALKGASTGATIGLNPALLAATSGLSALAVPVGAGIGAIVANKKAKEANDEAMSQFKQNQLEEQRAETDSRVQEAMRQRDLGYAKGGKIEGKGTGTSDGIVAKVKAGSFVVPAKNSEVAEEIREKVLKKAPTKKASLKQEGGENVKLSDGEHLFTPEETAELEARGINLEALAPEARHELGEYLRCGGKVKNYAIGGTVEEDGTEPTSDAKKKYPAAEANRKKNEAKKVAPKRTSQKSETTAFKTEAEKLAEDIAKFETESFGEAPEDAGIVAAVKRAPGYGEQAKSALSSPTGNPRPATITAAGGNPSNAGDSAAEVTGGNQRTFNADGLTGALNYAVPVAQSIVGWNQLQKQGKRPVDKLDPDYLARIEEAKRREGIAAKEAQYGFTPEEKFLLEQQNQGLLNQQRFGARAYSGGSGASALGGERLAINDAFGRGLMTKVQDKNLQLQKQAIAADRGQYVDQLVGNKTEMARRLFGDTMNAFQQNQNSGAALLGAGLKNIVEASRYNQELEAAKKAGTTRNSWMNSIGQQS